MSERENMAFFEKHLPELEITLRERGFDEEKLASVAGAFFSTIEKVKASWKDDELAAVMDDIIVKNEYQETYTIHKEVTVTFGTANVEALQTVTKMAQDEEGDLVRATKHSIYVTAIHLRGYGESKIVAAEDNEAILEVVAFLEKQNEIVYDLIMDRFRQFSEKIRAARDEKFLRNFYESPGSGDDSSQ